MDTGAPVGQDPEEQGAPDAAELALWERFLAGASTAADEISIRSWSAGGPANAEAVRRAAVAAVSGPAAPEVDVAAMLRELRRRGYGEARPRSAGGRRRRQLAAAIGWAAAAAAVILTARVGQATVRSVRVGVRDTGTYRTGPGERLRVDFEDGAEIAAAPNSSVRVSGPSGRRSIYLSGTAYVDGRRASGRSMIVHARNAVVQTVGGRFTVRTDSDAREVRIAVATGVVLAGDSEASWRGARLVTDGALGVVSAQGDMRWFRSSDPDDALVWESTGARFDRARLRDALPLVRWQDG